MLNASQNRTKRAALRLALMSSTPAMNLGWLAMMPTDGPLKRAEQKELRTTEQNNFYLTLYKHPAYREGRITIVDGEGKSFKFKKENKTIHFCTADSLMYRLEDDIEHRKAIGNFGDSQTAKELETVFDQAFNSGLKKIHLNEIFN